MGKVCYEQTVFPPPKARPLSFTRRSSIMLLVVLCSFSASVVKQNLKFLSPSTYRKWWITTPEYVAAFSASNYYCSNGDKTLTKVITSCLEAAIVVNFCQEIFLAQCEFVTSKIKASRMDCFKVYALVTTHLAKRLLSSVLKQRVVSSTITYALALRTQRSLLPN